MDNCTECALFSMCYQRRELAALLDRFAREGGVIDVRTAGNEMYGDGGSTSPMLGLLLASCCVHGGLKEEKVAGAADDMLELAYKEIARLRKVVLELVAEKRVCREG